MSSDTAMADSLAAGNDVAPWRRIVGTIDARVVGIAALFALGRDVPFEHFASGNFGRALAFVGRSELTAALVLLFCALLLAAPRVPRPVSLAFGVAAGCLLAHWLTEGPFLSHDYGDNFPGGTPSRWTAAWFFARREMVLWGLLATAWYFADRALHRTAQLHASALARRHFESRLAEARLGVMHAQVEPHFIFNTLAHLRHLFKSDAAVAQCMLDKLCGYLRAAFPLMRHGASTLDCELALASAYLEVQRLRLGDRLAFDIEVPRAHRGRPFPPMMLLTLVENAVKHGISPRMDGGHILMSAHVTTRTLRVVVADTGVGMSLSRGTGIGLANIASRLAALYGDAGRLTLIANRPRGLRATIEIPLVPDQFAGAES